MKYLLYTTLLTLLVCSGSTFGQNYPPLLERIEMEPRSPRVGDSVRLTVYLTDRPCDPCEITWLLGTTQLGTGASICIDTTGMQPGSHIVTVQAGPKGQPPEENSSLLQLAPRDPQVVGAAELPAAAEPAHTRLFCTLIAVARAR